MRVRHYAVDHGGVASRIHIVLTALVAAVRVAWVVRVVGGGGDHASVRTCTRHRSRGTLSVVT